MKIKIFMLMAVLAGAALTGCNGNQKQTATCVGESEMSGISFQVAKNYFFRNDQEIPASSKITTAWRVMVSDQGPLRSSFALPIPYLGSTQVLPKVMSAF
jgi:hypothetical protein